MVVPDSIIFDLDGTLWDTAALCADAWNKAIQASGLLDRKIGREDIASIMGLTAENVAKKIFPSLDMATAMQVLGECLKAEVLLLDQKGGILYPGVAEGLEQLAKQYKLFLVSNCETSYLETFLRTSGLANFFVDSECHGRTGLPKSENIKLIVARNYLKRPLYVGDTRIDEEACRVAKVHFAYVSYGFGRAEAPDLRFDSFPMLTTHLQELAQEYAVKIRPASALEPELHQLIFLLDEETATLYPPEVIFPVSAQEMAKAGGTILVAEIKGQVCACGAIVPYDGYAELKRIFVMDGFRNFGLGKKIVRALEAEAMRQGFSYLRLETGEAQPDAVALYIKEGFKRIPNYGIYAGQELSWCYEKKLAPKVK